MPNWKINLKEAGVHGDIISGSFDGIIERDIIFTECDQMSKPLRDYGYYMISTEKWDQHWKSDIINYLPRNLNALPQFLVEGLPKNRRKIKQLIEAVELSGSINAPHLTAPYSLGSPKVSDGRHRYWLIRELGIPAFLAVIPHDVIDAFEKNELLC